MEPNAATPRDRRCPVQPWRLLLLLPLLTTLVVAAEDKTRPKEPPKPEVQLLKAIWDGDLPRVRELLDAGVNPNGDEDNRPLFLAAQLLDADMVRLLIASKADPQFKGKYDRDLYSAAKLKGWLKLVLGREATQLEKDRDLIQAAVLHHGGRMLQEKSRIPHWGQGLIGHKIGQAFFWTGMGSRNDGCRMARSGAAVMAFLRERGAGKDPRSPIWTPALIRLKDRFPLDASDENAFANGSIVWASGQSKRLVCGGTEYAPLWRFQFYIFDETLHLVGVGEAPRMAAGVSIVPQRIGSLVPYAFVEYRSLDERLPVAARGTWMPALAYVGAQEDRPFVPPSSFCSNYERQIEPDLPQDRALIQPVDLHGAAIDARAIEYGLWDLKDVEVRFAEAGDALPKDPFKLKESLLPQPPPKRASEPKEPYGSSRPSERAAWPDPARAKAYEQIFARVERMRTSKQVHLFCSADPGGVHCLCAYTIPVGWDGLFFAGTEWAPQKPVIDWRFRKGVVWKRDGGDRIVIADARRSFALGTAGVFAFDKDLNLVAVGEYQTDYDNPESIALVEFRSSDSRLPAPMRNEWNLALAHNELYKQKIDTTKPVSFGVWPVAAPGQLRRPGSHLTRQIRQTATGFESTRLTGTATRWTIGQ